MSTVLQPPEHDDADQVLYFKLRPSPKQIREKAVDDSIKKNFSIPFRIEIPHFSRHLNEKYKTGSLAPENWDSRIGEESGRCFVTSDMDALDIGFDGTKKQH